MDEDDEIQNSKFLEEIRKLRRDRQVSFIKIEHDQKIRENIMKKPTKGEFLNNRPWISITDKLPRDRSCVEFASHQYYGLANWSKEKGFHEVFLTLGPSEEAEYFKDCAVWNGEIMWWREICTWPYYGEQGHDAESMKEYDKG